MRSLFVLALVPVITIFFVSDRPEQAPPVKSIFTVCYTAAMKDGELVKGEREWYQSYRNDTRELYNKDGDRIQVIDYDEEGKIESKTDYTYSSDKELKQLDVYEFEDDREKLEYSVKFYYDHKKFCYLDTHFNEQGEATLLSKSAMDYNENIEARKVLYPNGDILFSEITYFNEDSSIQKIKEYDAQNRLGGTIFYFRDTTKRTSSYYTVVKEDTADYNESKYDKYGRVIQERFWSGQLSEPERQYQYKYKLNDYGDWVQRWVFIEDELVYIEERYIEYYEE